MEKTQEEVAKEVYDVIHSGKLRIDVVMNNNYYSSRKINETINDVNSFLNYLSPAIIINYLPDCLDCKNLEEIINFIISDYSNYFIRVECRIPKKYNNSTQIKKTRKKKRTESILEVVLFIFIVIFSVLLLKNKI